MKPMEISSDLGMVNPWHSQIAGFEPEIRIPQPRSGLGSGCKFIKKQKKIN